MLSVCSNTKEEAYLAVLFSDVAKALNGTIRGSQARISLRSQSQLYPGLRRNNFEGIDFNDLSVCRRYLNRYASCHAALARYGTELSFPELSTRLLQRDTLKIVSVGGGPGNDLMGFCSAIARCRPRLKELQVTVVDKASCWKQVFERVIRYVCERHYGDVSTLFRNLRVTSNFVTADLAAASPPRDIELADIVLMTKVISAVPDAEKDLILKNIFSCMKPDAIFLFIDTDGHVVLRNSFGMTPLYRRVRDVFEYHQNIETSSITRSAYEVCTLRKFDPWPWQNIWMLAAADASDYFKMMQIRISRSGFPRTQ